MSQIVFGAFVGCLWASMAHADITAFMQAWDVLPEVQITQGRAGNCEANRSVFGPAQMAKGFRQTYPGTGSQGEDICWRRTADPFNSASGWSPWTRCTLDGDCEIR
jgi:hypothetical protein